MIHAEGEELAARLAGPDGPRERTRLLERLATLERELAAQCAQPTLPDRFTKLQAARLAVQAAAATLERIELTTATR